PSLFSRHPPPLSRNRLPPPPPPPPSPPPAHLLRPPVRPLPRSTPATSAVHARARLPATARRFRESGSRQAWRARICCGGRRTLFDSAKGDGVRSRSQVIERNIELLEDMATKVATCEELPLSAFCRTSVSEWEAFRSIDMDAEARLMQHMKKSSEKQRTHVDEDELIALNAWRRIDRQTRDCIKRNFLPDLLEIYEILPSFL
ncbi:hypothetical protein U9M48_034556, partial [Paspalum notatum var. saurae]